MAQRSINVGTTANDGTGDSIRIAGIKINDNFTELYATTMAQSTITVTQNNITATQTNDDINLIPAGTGVVKFPSIEFDDNNIRTTNGNDNLGIIPNGSGYVIIDGLGFSGTGIHATDSSTININDNVTIDGDLSASSLLDTGATQFGSTVSVPTGLATLASLTVSGTTSFVGTTTIDNLTFNDNIIATSSNADLLLTPGGAGVVNVSNLTIDSSFNLTDNVIKLTNSDADMELSANGSGSVHLADTDIKNGTIDNTTIVSGTSATFTSLTLSPASTATLSTSGVRITDNTITATESNANLEFTASGVGYVTISGIQLPHVDGTLGQVLQTNGSGTLDWFTSPILFDQTDITDATATVLGNSSAAQVIDSFAVATYRSAKYHIQISDGVADRYTLLDAAVMHDGSNAYISTYGISGNGEGDGSTIYDSIDFSVDVNGGNVRLLGTVNNTNNQEIKLVRRTIKV
jgi:hypothetical protein